MSIMSFISYYEYYRPEKPIKKAKSKRVRAAHPLKQIATPYNTLQTPANPRQNPPASLAMPGGAYQSYQPGVNAPPVTPLRMPPGQQMQYPPEPSYETYNTYG